MTTFPSDSPFKKTAEQEEAERKTLEYIEAAIQRQGMSSDDVRRVVEEVLDDRAYLEGKE